MTTRSNISKPVLYLMVLGDEGEYVKIGVTGNLFRRIRNVMNASPLEYKWIEYLPCKDMKEARRLEAWLHEFMRAKWIKGEWFSGKGGGFEMVEQAQNILAPSLDGEWLRVKDIATFIQGEGW